MSRFGTHAPSALLGAFIAGTTFALTSMAQHATTQRNVAGAPGTPVTTSSITLVQQEILSHMSIVQLPDGQGGMVKTLRISGVNVQIVNGLGATNGNAADPNSLNSTITSTNGLGNLIVGYNEFGPGMTEVRTGSHNLVTGNQQSYSSFGGFVAGGGNSVSAPFAATSGGRFNAATGNFSAVSGGRFNTAEGAHSSASGGELNLAMAARSSVSGGASNIAAGESSSILGGELNQAGGARASVTGGSENTAEGDASCVTGGQLNGAFGQYSMVSGGSVNVVVGDRHWRGGECILCVD